MAQTNWEADKMLDVYIYDYLVKRNLQASAKAFQAEGKVSPDPVAIDAPGGFLFEWWSVFWDIFIARTNEKHSEVAASYIETQQLKAREQQQQQHLHLQLLQRHAQQQQQSRSINGAANGLNANALLRQSTANDMARKIYEERLKQSQQRDGVEDPSSKQRFGELPGQLLEGNQTAVLKTGSAPCQPSGQLLHNAAGNMTNALQQVQVRNQQISGASQENKSDASTAINQRSITDQSCFGAAGVGPKTGIISSGANQGPNNMQRKDWPLTGLDQIRSNSLSQKPLIQSPQSQYHQLQQQLLLQAQAQGNISSSNSPILGDMDNRRFRALMNRNPFVGRDGQINGSIDMPQGVASSMQATSPLARVGQEGLLMKINMAQLQAQQQLQGNTQMQQSPQQVHPSQQQQAAGLQQQQQQDRLVGAGGVALDGLPQSFRGNDQSLSKGQNGRKRKQPGSCSGPANSTGTGNTAGPSPNSAPSTPSTHTPGDAMTNMAGGMQHSGSTSKPLMIYSSDGTGALASPSNHLADIDRFGEDGSLDDNVESFLSHEEADPREGLFGSTKRNSAGHNMDVSKGFSFQEVGCLRSSNSKVVSCHFSSDGKLLASAGHDKKAVLWNMDTLKLKSTLEEHSLLITDVRFSPNSTRLATSSFDRSVRVWDADNPSFSIRSFMGHQGSVTSLDFHPSNEDLLCSCDDNNEIRYWNVNQGICTKAFKGGMKQVRFQPRAGRLLAAAAENIVSIFDVNSESCVHSLQGHIKPVHCVCWDATGDFLASVSDESVRVWALGSGGGPECLHELGCNGNIFHSCVFHPTYSSLLVIGCYQSLELWNMADNKSMTVPAHDCVIAGLAQSPVTGMVASASHDKCVKLWK